MTRRAERISSLIRQDICELLREHTNDPRLKSLISVTQVQTSPDLKNAKVFVSVLGDKKQSEEALKAFKSAAGYNLHLSLLSKLKQKTIILEIKWHRDENKR